MQWGKDRPTAAKGHQYECGGRTVSAMHTIERPRWLLAVITSGIALTITGIVMVIPGIIQTAL